jgi:hypothetical protein
VTQARRPLSEDIAYRQRRYLVMMGVRAVCFITAVIMFVNHLGWLAIFPVVLAIFIPYFAVVFANGGREPDNTRGFMEHQWHLPPGSDDTGQRTDPNGTFRAPSRRSDDV